MIKITNIIAASIAIISLSVQSEIIERANCFSDRFSTYEKFQNFIQKMNPGKEAFMAQKIDEMVGQKNFNQAKKHLNCTNITYKNDGFLIKGYMITPKGIENQKLPIVVYNRGGNANYGAIKFVDLFSTLIPLAHKNYIVVASQYRGLVPERPEIFGIDEFGGRDVEDVHSLIELVKQHPNADIDNIFLVGASRGAMMNYLVAKDRKDIRAIVSIAGPSDNLKDLEWRPEMEEVYKHRIPNYAENKEAELKKRSVLYWPEKLPENTPILLMHGDKDKRVHVRDSINLNKKLNDLGRPNKLIIYPGDNHFLSKNKEQAFNSIVSWIEKHRLNKTDNTHNHSD